MPFRSISEEINPHKFRVVIVGGSIAGLTLAHALAAYSIDFVVLEAREEIAPNVGASIGFTGNSPRILDQLGVWDELAELATPIINNYAWNDKGHLLGYTGAFKLSQVRSVLFSPRFVVYTVAKYMVAMDTRSFSLCDNKYWTCSGIGCQTRAVF